MKLRLSVALLFVIGIMACKDDEKGGLVLPIGGITVEQPKAVTKTNKMPVYMHYMPWFDSPEFGSGWGIHWKMSLKDPNVVGDNGRRQIASHYYPLIGPYDSQDETVINYHLLLMKYAGIDGVLINWYGTAGSNGDINDLLINSNAIIDRTDDIGMKFSVVMEDRFAANVDDVKTNISYLQQNYYNNKQFIKVNNRPLTLIFGPITISGAEKWTEILNASTADEIFMPLWYKTSNLGTVNSGGEYAWVYKDNISGLTNFYNGSKAENFVGGGAFPGFNDYYTQGGWGDGIDWVIDVSASQMKQTLDLAKDKNDKLDFVQLITWNDFGEGTMIEPTVEFEFQFLEEIQAYSGVSYGVEELELIYEWYTKTKDPAYKVKVKSDKLKQIFYYLVALKVTEAQSLMDELNK